jgi:V-type H+-transporting ATPase subunit H
MAAAPRLAAAGGGPPVGADELADVQRVLDRAGTAGVPWDAFASSRLIGEREAQALRRYDAKPEALQASLLDEVSVDHDRWVGGESREQRAGAFGAEFRLSRARAAPTRHRRPSNPHNNPETKQFGPSIVGAIVSVLRNVSSEEAVQHALALLVAMLVRSPGRAKLLAAPLPAEGGAAATTTDLLSGDGGAASPASPDATTTTSVINACPVLLRLLQRPDWFTQEKAARVLAEALAARPPRSSAVSAAAATSAAAGPSSSSEIGVATEPLSGSNATTDPPLDPTTAAFLEWCCAQLRRPANPARSVPCAVRALSLLLRDKSARAAFTRAGGPALLCPLLRAVSSPAESQLLYELCLCFWQLSFCRPAAEASVAAGAVPGLVASLRAAHKEKVVRVALFALRNLLEAEPEIEGVAHQAAEAGLAKVVATRRLQTWGDEDVSPALEKVGERLAKGVESLSSWEAYRRELTSGRLDWGPVHTSEAFWRANAACFEERDFQPLRVLLRLLEASREPRTLAVGCHDLGKFVEHHPQGRFIAADLRGKELAMRLMAHPDPDVQKRALIAVQKCMLPRDKLSFLSSAAA